MRLTITVDEARGRVRVAADRARDYRPRQVRWAVAAAVQRVADQLHYQPPTVTSPADEPDGPRPHGHGHGQPATGPPGEADSDEGGLRVEVTRGRVLRALDRGATVAEAAEWFGLDPQLIDRWDDDAAADARTDLIAAGPGAGRWPR